MCGRPLCWCRSVIYSPCFTLTSERGFSQLLRVGKSSAFKYGHFNDDRVRGITFDVFLNSGVTHTICRRYRHTITLLAEQQLMIRNK